MSSRPSASKRSERFHGAFTGGFSAGFFNSVGTAEGWTPSSFSSSRDKRAVPKEQRPEDFMDEEDGLLTEHLQTKPAYDTLGSTANEIAKKYAEREATGGAIPGPTPSELIMSIGESMGKKLLRTMGWREGQGIGNRVRRKKQKHVISPGDDSPEEELPEQARAGLGKKALELIENEGLTFAPRNTDFKMQPLIGRTGLHGIGHEPFRDAPEFRASREARNGGREASAPDVYRTQDIAQHRNDEGAAGAAAKTWLSRGSRPSAAMIRGSHGFTLDDGEDDVYEVGFGTDAYDKALDDGTHDSLADNAKAWALDRAGDEDNPMLTSRRYARCPSDGRLPPTGFVVAQRAGIQPKHWAPPAPPANFRLTIEFENEAEKSSRPPASHRQGIAGLVPGRARLLGEPSGRLTSTPAETSMLVDQDKAHLQDRSTTLSFLSPAARKRVLAAANGKRDLSRFSQLDTVAATSFARAGASTAENPVEVVGTTTQENARRLSEGLPFSLKNRFVSSEKQPQTNATGAIVEPVGGGDTALHPAGLTIRMPATSGILNTWSTGSAPEEKNSTKEEEQTPVRHTREWSPSALLCKRMNVPVPNASLTAKGLASKDKLNPARDATASAADQDSLGSLRKFVPQSSASSQPKVPLLQGMEQRPPVRTTSTSLLIGVDRVATDEGYEERPPLDLFKSIFESESESESEVDDDSGGEESKVAAGKADSTTRALPTDTIRASESILHRTSLHRGYGTDSSDESENPGVLGAEHRVGDNPSKKLEERGRADIGWKRPREGIRNVGGENNNEARERDSDRRKRSSGKHGGHKHKKHKKDRSGTKDRKYEHKRKKSKHKR